MFIEKYRLNQHSILIHFQVNQSENSLNVCLRSTEVKPKLDRFIVKKFGGRAGVIEKHKDWICAENLNGVDLALNYKMSIRCNSQNVTVYKTKNKKDNDDTPKLPDIYYGNMGDNVEKKYGVFFNDGLTIRIVCFNDELGKVIDQYIAEFFVVTNFGTMQSKGFGSFTIQGCDMNIPKVLKENYGANACYMIRTNQKGESSCAQNELFDTIKQVYSEMKSGIRQPFDHSYLYRYAHKYLKMGNEKAKMKIDKVSPNLQTSRKNNPLANNHPHYYIRALLGIGQEISYITDIPGYYVRDKRGNIKYNRNGNPILARENIKIYHSNEQGEKLDSKKDKVIERASSPIFFKIIENKIYFVAGRINKEIYSKTFTFCNEDKYAIQQRGAKENNTILKTIPKNEFDIDHFMKCFVDYYNDTFIKSVRERLSNSSKNNNRAGNNQLKDYKISEEKA